MQLFQINFLLKRSNLFVSTVIKLIPFRGPRHKFSRCRLSVGGQRHGPGKYLPRPRPAWPSLFPVHSLPQTAAVEGEDRVQAEVRHVGDDESVSISGSAGDNFNNNVLW